MVLLPLCTILLIDINRWEKRVRERDVGRHEDERSKMRGGGEKKERKRE
jgi:hypothetical protein